MQIIEKLQRSRPEIVHLFDQIVKTLPDGVYLTGVTQSGDHLKFTGVAQSSTRVSAFMRNIDSSQWMKNPTLEVIQSAPGRVRLELHARCRVDRGRCERRRRWPGASPTRGSPR